MRDTADRPKRVTTQPVRHAHHCLTIPTLSIHVWVSPQPPRGGTADRQRYNNYPHHPHTRTPAQRCYRRWDDIWHGSAQHTGRRPTLGHSRHSAESWPHANRLQAIRSSQPTRWSCTQNNKSHFPLAYVLTGISHRSFEVDREEL